MVAAVTSPTGIDVGPIGRRRLPPHHLVTGEVRLGPAVPPERGVVGELGRDDPAYAGRARSLCQRPQGRAVHPRHAGDVVEVAELGQVAELDPVLDPYILMLVFEHLGRLGEPHGRVAARRNEIWSPPRRKRSRRQIGRMSMPVATVLGDVQ